MAKVGRKSVYETKVLSNLNKIRQWMINKNTDEFIANGLGIGYSTWMKFKAEKKEILELIEETPKSRAALIEDVRQSIIERAKGMDYEESKTILVTDEQTGKPKILRKEIYKKKALPDPTAAKEALFILGDKESSSRANFDIKVDELAFKKEQAKADSEWVVEEVEDNE